MFNRMASVYDARPAYPAALVDALAALASETRGNVVDVGAGIGHLALPLAARGFAVVAVEPARAMLDELETNARRAGVSLRALHATAEALPLDDASAGVVLVADALHFIDKELAALEIDRVLGERGALAVVTSEITPTPFMRGLVALMESAAPRRPRDVAPSITQLMRVTNVAPAETQSFADATPVDAATLERILRSISFIGPAMNPERFAAFRERVHALDASPVWARTLRLFAGRRRRRAARAG